MQLSSAIVLCNFGNNQNFQGYIIENISVGNMRVLRSDLSLGLDLIFENPHQIRSGGSGRLYTLGLNLTDIRTFMHFSSYCHDEFIFNTTRISDEVFNTLLGHDKL